MKALLLTYAILLSAFIVKAQHLHDHNHDHHHDHGHHHVQDNDYKINENAKVSPLQLSRQPGLAFIKNQNQWHENIAYKASFGGLSAVFLEQQKFTYLFSAPKDVEKIHDALHDNSEVLVNRHAYRVHFRGSQQVEFEETDPHRATYNYFLGNDQSRWASNVPLFNKITYPDLYPGIDLEAYNNQGHFKYDFIVKAGIDPNVIQLEFEGIDALEIDNGNLVVYTSVGEIIEQRPYTYQVINGKEVRIPCEYELRGDLVSFVFPNGYDQSEELIIDPTVIASTLSGMADNYSFGHTACFDNQGNIYAGGRAFGTGYQTTSGAFQTLYGGGQTDIAVTKYNPEGTAQIYATYLGGEFSDAPHSMITDFNGQLYVLGSSSSEDYPVSNNAFQPTKGLFGDIVVTKLNSNGSGIVGSTFVGGSGSDGQNLSSMNSNYDDTYRGEIVLDNQNNVYIASCTSSDNFPVTPGAYDTEQNVQGVSLQDGVVFKLNSDLSTMFWGTYLGGSDADGAFGLRVDDFGKVYVTGFAGDSDFPTTPGTVQPNWVGGNEKAFVAILNSTGSSLVASTFWGANDGDEHSFFIDIDEDGNIHIYGQTTGEITPTPNTYFYNEGSRQFLTSFSSDLTSIVYSTVVGNGPNSFSYDMVPVAFMVDKCNNIYFSGYYAAPGLPTTSDAISTIGGSVYLGVLNPLATSLQFGTYYGSADHVDGGTSRFDKSGTVYQGVCSCTSSGTLNTLPGAFATNQATFCDIGVFKIDFDVPTVTAAAVASPATSGCVPFEVTFTYTGQDATIFDWDFDDNGAGSNQPVTSHTFTEPGTYTVQLIAQNQATCNSVDTSYLVIDVLEASSTLTDTTICDPDEIIFLDATTINASYEWHDGSTNATYSAMGEGIYWVDVSLLNGLCTRRDSFVLVFNNALSLNIDNNVTACDEPSYTIDATTPGAAAYEWDDGSTNATLTVSSSGIYAVSVFDSDGCALSEQVEVNFSTTPVFDLGPDTTLCDLYTLPLVPDFPGATFTWSDGSTSDTFIVTDAGTYWVEVNDNGCIASDTITVDYLAEVFLDINSTDIDCYDNCNGIIDASISGGNGQLNFLWSNGVTVPSQDDLCGGDYTLTITDDLCNYVLSTIEIYEPAPITYDYIFEDVQCPGDGDGSITITSVDGGTAPFLYSYNGNPFADTININGLSGGDYEFVIMDANGCTAGETINIYEPPAIVVDAGPDIEIELGESETLGGQVFPITNQIYFWSPADSLSCIDCLRPTANPTNTTIYTLTVVDSITGCVLEDSMVLRVIKNRNVYIPNAFTPNDDGLNDIFTIYTGNGVRRILDFKVYDRWGALVFADEDILPNHNSFGWDGFFKGRLMNNAVFAWYAEVEFLDDEIILYKGDVTLVR